MSLPVRLLRKIRKRCHKTRGDGQPVFLLKAIPSEAEASERMSSPCCNKGVLSSWYLLEIVMANAFKRCEEDPY